MNTKLMSFVAVLGASLLSTVVFAEGGNGGGYNGPITSGQSIPIQVDAGYTKAQLRTSLAKCTGQLARQVVSQIGKTETLSETQNGSQLWDNGAHMVSQTFIYDPQTNAPRVYYNTDSVITTVHQSYECRSFMMMVSVTDILNGHSSLQFSTHEQPSDKDCRVPYLTYQTEIPDSAYDELGRVQDDRVLVLGLELHVPANLSSAVRVWNNETHHPTSITVNMAEYAQCLMTELQR